VPTSTLVPPGFVPIQVDSNSMVVPLGQQPVTSNFNNYQMTQNSLVAQQGQHLPPIPTPQVVRLQHVGQQPMVAQQGQPTQFNLSLGEHQPSPFRATTSTLRRLPKPNSILGSQGEDFEPAPSQGTSVHNLDFPFVPQVVSPTPSPSIPAPKVLGHSTPNRPSIVVTVPNPKTPTSKGSVASRLGEKRGPSEVEKTLPTKSLKKNFDPNQINQHSGLTPPDQWGDFSKSIISDHEHPDSDKDKSIDKSIDKDTSKLDQSSEQTETKKWKDLVSVIGSQFDIGPRSPARPTSRISDTFDVTPEPSSRSRLPLYPALDKAFEFTRGEIASSAPAKGKYPGPLPKGKFPKVDRKKRAHPPSSWPKFLGPAPWDSSLLKMGAGGNPDKENLKTIVAPEILRKMEEDQRTAVSSLSSSLWSLSSAERILKDLCSQTPSNSSLQDATDLVSAAKTWALTTADRLVVGLSTSLLMRRDGAISAMDYLVPLSTRDSLRAAPLLSTSLLGDKSESALADLQQARVSNKPTQAIREIVSLTKAMVKPTKPSNAAKFSGNQKTKTFQGKPQPNRTAPSFVKTGFKAPATTAAPSTSVVPPKKRRYRGPSQQKGGKQ
jgi:hypothetical protein